MKLGSPTIHLSVSSFELTWIWQKSITFRDANFHLICQHATVFTFGHGARLTYAKRFVNRHRIDRGGEIAYHDAGHLLFYALIPCQQLPLHLNALHSTAASILRALRLHNYIFDQGIWLDQSKWMSIGIKLIRVHSRVHFLHGICLPIASYLPPDFHPCHLPHAHLTSLETYRPYVSCCQSRYCLSISAKQNFS
jgi:lipoate-protein ligase B